MRIFWWCLFILNIAAGANSLWLGGFLWPFSFLTALFMWETGKRRVIVSYISQWGFDAYIVSSAFSSPKGKPQMKLTKWNDFATLEGSRGGQMVSINFDDNKRLVPHAAMRLRISVPALKRKMRRAKLVAQWKEEGRKWTSMWLIWHELRQKASRVSSYATLRSGAVRKLRNWRASRATVPTVNA